MSQNEKLLIDVGSTYFKVSTDEHIEQHFRDFGKDILDDLGNESEATGIQFCTDLLGGTWIQTSYNSSFRKNYAYTGDTYDAVRDAFIPVKPHPSCVFNEDTCRWETPDPE